MTDNTHLFNTLVLPLLPRIRALVRRYVWSAAHAEDVEQEVLIHLFLRIDSCDLNRPLVPWVDRTVRNAIADRNLHYRRADNYWCDWPTTHSSPHSAAHSSDDTTDACAAAALPMPSPAAIDAAAADGGIDGATFAPIDGAAFPLIDAAAAAIDWESLSNRRLSAAIGAVDERQRCALLLRADGEDYAFIAACCHCSQPMARQLVARGRRAVRERYSPLPTSPQRGGAPCGVRRANLRLSSNL